MDIVSWFPISLQCIFKINTAKFAENHNVKIQIREWKQYVDR